MAGFRHAIIERNATLLAVLTVLVVAIGGIFEIVPLFTIGATIEPVRGVRPYSPLELMGRNIYVREGCYLCHSQQIRTLRDEVDRYGHYSLAAESMYDHPFQWGSKRNGPDLAREGGKATNDWHYLHLTDPRSQVPDSIMPAYDFMARTPLSYDDVADHLKANRLVGVPYSDEMITRARADLETQGQFDADQAELLKRYPKSVVVGKPGPHQITEMDALVAYLQVLGTMVDFADVTQEELQR